MTRYGHVLPGFERHRHVELIEAGHPVPARTAWRPRTARWELAHGLGARDLALVLVSGGGSALWCLPVPGLRLEDKRRITSELLRAGASIRELNNVRRALSRIKGGKLAEAAAPTRVETLIISDVVGDDPGIIASGPAVPGVASADEVQATLERFRVVLPAGVRPEPPPGAPRGNACWRIVAAASDALGAAAEAVRAADCEVRLLGDAVEGAAREAAAMHAAIARDVAKHRKPLVILSGGELAVTVRGAGGIGGPNAEFLLALALDGAARTWAIACATDGYDGVSSCAGALIGPDTLARAKALGLDPVHALEASDSAGLFEALGDAVVTGPTQTNVSDFRAILIGGEP